MSKSHKSRGRGGLRRHIKMRMARQGHGRRIYKSKKEPAGAYALAPERLRYEPADVEAVQIVTAPRGDDGAAYEKLGPAIRELTTDLHEMRAATMWFAASSFMVTMLKEIIRYLHERHGWDGLAFLEELGFHSMDDLAMLDDLSGTAVCDLLEAALSAASGEDRAALGLVA